MISVDQANCDHTTTEHLPHGVTRCLDCGVCATDQVIAVIGENGLLPPDAALWRAARFQRWFESRGGP